ncbi:MAG: hypothetical protein ACT4PZ_03845 [Panacagrimonas sp.]
MSRRSIYLLGAAALMFAAQASAKSPFDGLEMDVIGAGQVPNGPTARIALPRPLAPGAETGGMTGYEDSIADSLIHGESAPSALGATDSLGPETTPPAQDESP